MFLRRDLSMFKLHLILHDILLQPEWNTKAVLIDPIITKCRRVNKSRRALTNGPANLIYNAE